MTRAIFFYLKNQNFDFFYLQNPEYWLFLLINPKIWLFFNLTKVKIWPKIQNFDFFDL